MDEERWEEIKKSVTRFVMTEKLDCIDRETYCWLIAMRYGWTFEYVSGLSDEDLARIGAIEAGMQKGQDAMRRRRKR